MSEVTKFEPKQDVAERAPSSGAMTPMEMLDRILSDPQASTDKLEKVMDMAERWEANQARKAFDEAMAAAKAEIPVIGKNRLVDYTSQKGRTSYRHEDLGEIARTVDPILAKWGLSYRYRTEQENGNVKVTCIVSHRDGHYEENSLSAGSDQTGNKNSIQAIGSTTTYLQRYTLKSALGLAASYDDDGALAAKDDGKTITDKQCDELLALADHAGADKRAFCEWLGVDSFTAIPANRFDKAKNALQRKKAKVDAGS